MMTRTSAMARRRFLKTALAAGTWLPAASLTGCADLIRALGNACPADPAESGGIDWTPDVLHPVFYGFQDLTTANGAPGPVRVWYPTYEGFTENAPMLKLCLKRWPVVLFLHGQPPCPVPNYHRQWTMIPAVLAKSGYVVVVPSHSALLPFEQASPEIGKVLGFIDWIRSGWQHAKWTDARAEATAVVGHSYGALLAARVAQARPSISAYAGLSAPWSELRDRVAVVQGIGAPSFFMWATGDPLKGAFENMDDLGLWNAAAAPKHAAVFPGEHFDYLRAIAACSYARGGCTLIEPVTAELIALFLARAMPVSAIQSQIPVTLNPPTVPLTPKQEFFIGGQFSGLKQIKTRTGCHVNLRWREGMLSGSRQLGP